MDLHGYLIMVALAPTAGAQAPPTPVSLTASIEPYRVIERGPALPEELHRESAIYLQRRLSAWKLDDARDLFGEPLRRRDASEDGVVTGDIYPFRDPSSRYREFELLFDRRFRTLRTIFVYPWKMTWKDCVELWSDDVSTTQNPDGTRFHFYRTRNLDVLLDASGSVINLGVY